MHKTQFTIHKTQFAMHKTQFTIHKTQFAIHKTQFTIHKAQYTNTQNTIFNTQNPNSGHDVKLDFAMKLYNRNNHSTRAECHNMYHPSVIFYQKCLV